MREKLIELVKEAEEHATDTCVFHDSCEDCPGRKYGRRCRDYLVADHLIANGVTIQKEGVWVGEADGYADGELVYDVWYCSECNYCIDDGTDDPDLLPNYCQKCGAKLSKPPKGE